MKGLSTRSLLSKLRPKINIGGAEISEKNPSKMKIQSITILDSEAVDNQKSEKRHLDTKQRQRNLLLKKP